MILLHTPLFLLLAVILGGHLLGKLRLWNFSLGSSAIIFSGLAFGLAGFSLPGILQTLGLALFIYAVGQQAGPSFLHSLKHGGLRLGIGALAMSAGGLIAALAVRSGFDFSRDVTAGMFAGALTSTPALAVAVEMAPHSQAPAAYGVTYLFGVFGAAVAVKILPRLLRIDLKEEERRLAEELCRLFPTMDFLHVRVDNPGLDGTKIADIAPETLHGTVITRILRAGKTVPELVGAETILHQNDVVRVVGTDNMLRQAQLLIGPRVDVDLDFNSGLLKKKILLSRPDVAGKTLRALNLGHVYGVRISRITRNGFDLPAAPSVRLRHGDILHAVGHAEALQNVRAVLGDNVRALYRINAMTMLAGLFCGLLLGALPLFVPGLGIVTLGPTGGVLVAGLTFGALRQIGPVITEMPETGIVMVRDLGLVLFLAVVGTRAGTTMLPMLQQYGWPLVLGGAILTLTTISVGVIVSLRVLRIPFLRTLGVVSGGMTSTPGLDAAQALSPTSYAATAYATVYPAALLGKIIAAKILMLL